MGECAWGTARSCGDTRHRITRQAVRKMLWGYRLIVRSKDVPRLPTGCHLPPSKKTKKLSKDSNRRGDLNRRLC